MPRPPKIWKRSGTSWYYATIDGRQVRLSQSRQEAQAMFERMRSERRASSSSVHVTVSDLANQFLDVVKQTRSHSTYIIRRLHLKSFCDFVGKSRRVSDITGGELERWALSRDLNGSTRNLMQASVLACLNWGVRSGAIVSHGVRKRRFPSAPAMDRVLTKDEREKIAKVTANMAISDLLFILEQTGCRPFSEAAKLTKDMIDWKNGSCTLGQHKTESKGKRRTIYFPPAALSRLEELATKRPSGPLLLTDKGKPWRSSDAAAAMRRIEKLSGVLNLTTYCWRHSYITDCLMKGMSPTIVATLVGNSAATISRYYDHCDQRKAELAAAAIQAVVDH